MWRTQKKPALRPTAPENESNVAAGDEFRALSTLDRGGKELGCSGWMVRQSVRESWVTSVVDFSWNVVNGTVRKPREISAFSFLRWFKYNSVQQLKKNYIVFFALLFLQKCSKINCNDWFLCLHLHSALRLEENQLTLNNCSLSFWWIQLLVRGRLCKNVTYFSSSHLLCLYLWWHNPQSERKSKNHIRCRKRCNAEVSQQDSS